MLVHLLDERSYFCKVTQFNKAIWGDYAIVYLELDETAHDWKPLNPQKYYAQCGALRKVALDHKDMPTLPWRNAILGNEMSVLNSLEEG